MFKSPPRQIQIGAIYIGILGSIFFIFSNNRYLLIGPIVSVSWY